MLVIGQAARSVTDDTLFAALLERWRAGQMSAESARLPAVDPLEANDLHRLPEPPSDAYHELVARGQHALCDGAVAALVVAGGMATRFAYSRPKGLFPILDGQSFLQLKLRWLLNSAPSLPILIMTSFYTDGAIRDYLEQNHYFGAAPGQIRCFPQGTFPRLTGDGHIFHSANPNERLASRGHGDFLTALQESGLLQELQAGGAKYLHFSNVDNLGGTLDPAILGWHILGGQEMSIEVAPKLPTDAGGAPARVGGRVQLVEFFALPPDFDHQALRVFNTANYIFTMDALARARPLPWYAVTKEVGGVPVTQFEQLAGDLSRELEVRLLVVDREWRLVQLKRQADVPAAAAQIRRLAALYGAY